MLYLSDKFKLENNLEKKPSFIIPDVSLQNNITIILSKKDRPEIVNQFINIIELAVYKKEIQNISFSIKLYENKKEFKEGIIPDTNIVEFPKTVSSRY